MNIICLISYFDIFPFSKALFPLQHICYYFDEPTPYPWTLTFSIFYIFTIHLSFQQPINCNYSRLLFDNIAYSPNNTGRRCVFVIHWHKGKCNLLIIILLLFCLSRQLPMDPHVVDCLHIYNTFFILTTDKPLHYIILQQHGWTLILCHLPT